MARIRTVKPEFFRHEQLQELEMQHPGKYTMLVFAGLWGHCDNRGRFEWRPRQLKLDILPFIEFDMAATLDLLAEAQMVVRYEVGGRTYGEIPTFGKHQRISGREASDGERFPSPGDRKIPEASGKIPENHKVESGKIGKTSNEGPENSGSIGEAVNVQEGKGKGIGRERIYIYASDQNPELESQIEGPPIDQCGLGWRPWDRAGSLGRLVIDLGHIRAEAGYPVIGADGKPLADQSPQVSRAERELYSEARLTISDKRLRDTWAWMWKSADKQAKFLRDQKSATLHLLLKSFAKYADLAAQRPPPDRMELLRLRNEAEQAKAAAQ